MMAIKLYLGTVLKGYVNYLTFNNIYTYHSALYVCICIYILVRNVHIRSPNTIYTVQWKVSSSCLPSVIVSFSSFRTYGAIISLWSLLQSNGATSVQVLPFHGKNTGIYINVIAWLSSIFHLVVPWSQAHIIFISCFLSRRAQGQPSEKIPGSHF